MHRIDGPGHAANMFTEGDPLTATPATVVTGDWLNEVQEEIISVLEAASITPTKGLVNQLLAAIVLKTGDTMTGDLSISAATSRTLKVESTNNNTLSIFQAKGKTSGGAVVEGRFVADNSGLIKVQGVSNHPVEIYTNDTLRMAISGGGGLTKMPVGYQSPPQASVPSSLVTLAHSLGAVPKQVWVVLVMTTAEGGHGIGDEVYPVLQGSDAGGAGTYGLGLSADATNIYLLNGASSISVYSRSSPGTTVVLTNANYNIIVRANP